MIKWETFELLKQIAVFYEQFTVDQQKVDLWHEVLKGYTFDEVEAKLHRFVQESDFPPKIADLVKKPKSTNTTSNQEETMTYIIRKPQPAPEMVVQTELAKMREILGIVRG